MLNIPCNAVVSQARESPLHNQKKPQKWHMWYPTAWILNQKLDRHGDLVGSTNPSLNHGNVFMLVSLPTSGETSWLAHGLPLDSLQLFITFRIVPSKRLLVCVCGRCVHPCLFIVHGDVEATGWHWVVFPLWFSTLCIWEQIFIDFGAHQLATEIQCTGVTGASYHTGLFCGLWRHPQAHLSCM
jgi:hypothetical protein